MKKVVLGALIVMGLASVALANEKYLAGVSDDGSAIKDNANIYYVVHGGCREYKNNPDLTEIWLYLAKTPNVAYAPYSNITATMYLPTKFETLSSIVVCNFLRSSYTKQTPVKMILRPEFRGSNDQIVKGLEESQILNNPDCQNPTTDTELLGNFQIRSK